MRVCVGLMVVLSWSSPAAAQPPGRIALADLVAEAIEKNPEIAAAQKRSDAARQRPLQERSLPDPMISAGYNSSGRPWPGAGLGSEPTANLGFVVSQQVPYPGKLGLRASMAAREADAEVQQVEVVKRSVASRVRQAYYRLAYTYAISDVLDRDHDLLETLVKVSENRYSVGRAAQQDVIKAQTQLSIHDLLFARVEQERATREGELNALLARAVGAPVGRPADLQLTPFDMSLAALVSAGNAEAPALKRGQILIDRSLLAVDAARKEYKPDFSVSGGYYNMGSMPPMYEVRFDVQIPLRRARRAAAVAERVSGVQEARSTLDSARLTLQSRIQEDYQAALTAVRLARLYHDTVLPQARLTLESSMTSYQTGSVDFLSVVTNFGAVLEYEMAYFEELATYHTAASRLEEMTGTPIVH
jgi:cobalt-zinc-cadmium efflux system outer membrane protein